MRLVSRAAAFFVALVIGIEIWKRWRFGGFADMSRPDISFIVILVLLLVGFLWLARSISREIRNHG